jgi:hypothetical protein
MSNVFRPWAVSSAVETANVSSTSFSGRIRPLLRIAVWLRLRDVAGATTASATATTLPLTASAATGTATAATV